MQHKKNTPLAYDVARAAIAEMKAYRDGKHWEQSEPFSEKIKAMLWNYAFADWPEITDNVTDITVVDAPEYTPSTTFLCVAPIIGCTPEIGFAGGSCYRTGNPDEVEGEPDLEAISHLNFEELLHILERWVEDDVTSNDQLSEAASEPGYRLDEKLAARFKVQEVLELASRGALPVISEETRLTKRVTLDNGRKLVFELYDDGHPDVGPHIQSAFLVQGGRRYKFEAHEIQSLSMQFVSGYAESVAAMREAESHWLESFPFKAYLSEGLFNFATAPQTVRQAFLARLEEYGDLPVSAANASPEERAKVIQEIELAFEDVEVAFAQVPRDTVAEAIKASWAWQSGSATWGGMEWEDYRAWYLRNHQVPDYPRTNRWPVMLSATSADEVFEDGWHRFHSYLKNGHETIPVVAFHHAAVARAVRQLRMTFRSKSAV